MARQSQSLHGKVAVVTGAGRGIGRSLAGALAREGCRVAIGDVDAASAAAAAEEFGNGAIGLPLDVTDRPAFTAFLDTVEDRLGPIDVLVNNAVAWPARAPGVRFEDVDLAAVRASVAANLVGQFALSQAVVGGMRRAGWGRIVHVSTGLVEDGFPGSAPYTTPKAGLHGLARTMSRELAGAGILTNVVMAGFVPDAALPEAVREQGRRSAATGRLTTADEVARVIVFLCSEANGNVTGEAIRADGHFLAIAS